MGCGLSAGGRGRPLKTELLQHCEWEEDEVVTDDDAPEEPGWEYYFEPEGPGEGADSSSEGGSSTNEESDSQESEAQEIGAQEVLPKKKGWDPDTVAAEQAKRRRRRRNRRHRRHQDVRTHNKPQQSDALETGPPQQRRKPRRRRRRRRHYAVYDQRQILLQQLEAERRRAADLQDRVQWLERIKILDH